MKVLSCLVIAFPLVSACLAGDLSPKDAPSKWQDCNDVSVVRTDGGETLSVTIAITPTDMLVDFWKDEAQKERKGRLVLTRDRFFAVSGIELDSPNDFLPLKSVLMNFTMVVRLLSRACAGGPQSVSTNVVINTKEADKDLIVSIPGSTFRVAAPWQVTGQISPLESNQYAYNLTLGTGQTNGNSQQFQFSGVMGYKKDLASDLPDSFSLAEWKAYEIRPIVEVHMGEQRRNYWAYSLKDILTLGALRKSGDLKAK
jgi:hypothetical protein